MNKKAGERNHKKIKVRGLNSAGSMGGTKKKIVVKNGGWQGIGVHHLLEALEGRVRMGFYRCLRKGLSHMGEAN